MRHRHSTHTHTGSCAFQFVLFSTFLSLSLSLSLSLFLTLTLSLSVILLFSLFSSSSYQSLYIYLSSSLFYLYPSLHLSRPHSLPLGDAVEGVPELTPVAIMSGKMLARRLYSKAHDKMVYKVCTESSPFPLGLVLLYTELHHATLFCNYSVH
jgi:hypothetical protein